MGNHIRKPVAAGAAIALSLACAAPATAGAEASLVVDWAYLFGDAGSSTVSTTCDSVNQTQRLSDGGFVAAATFDAPSGSTQEHAKGKADAVLVRYDANGGELWRGWVEGEKADLFKSTDLGDGAEEEAMFKRSDLGLRFGANVTFKKHYNVSLGYDLGLLNILKDADEVKAKNGSFFVSLGYNF